ncbi:MAG: hypothetical protein KDB23_31630 [Planctomycetales bacterium]|nr:hypothetical protein [Planctomycetales bacterium]
MKHSNYLFLFCLLLVCVWTPIAMADYALYDNIGPNDAVADQASSGFGFELPGYNREQAQGFLVPEFTSFEIASIEISTTRSRVNDDDMVRLALHANRVVTIPGGFVVDQPGDFIADFLIGEPLAENNTPKLHHVPVTGLLLKPNQRYWLVATTREPGVLNTSERLRWVSNANGIEGDHWQRLENGSWKEGSSLSLSLRVIATPKVVGDFDGNEVLDVGDIDKLSEAVRLVSRNTIFDLNGDGVTGTVDRVHWVRDLRNTYFGDADLNGEFNSADLINVFRVGEYQDTLTGNSTWSTGDWDGDGEFTTTDIVVAFQDGGYAQGPREAFISVPEPNGTFGLILLCLFATSRR